MKKRKNFYNKFIFSRKTKEKIPSKHTELLDMTKDLTYEQYHQFVYDTIASFNDKQMAVQYRNALV